MSGTTKTTTTPAKNVFCTVGCKLPHGIVLQLEKRVEGATGAAMVPIGPSYTLNGANTARVIGGYGLTPRIPVEFMDKWLEQFATFPPVASGLIFKEPNSEQAEDRAKAGASVTSGFEPMNPADPGKGLKPDDGTDGDSKKE